MFDPVDERTLGFATRAVHVGNEVDKDSGAIKRPITMANSYALPYDPSDMNWSSAGANLYTRNGGTNRKYLQERIASLEGGEDCVVLASGVAALSGLFFAMLNKGDHVIFSSVTYIAVYRLLNGLLNHKFGVETTIVDTTDPANVEAAIRPNTRLIHIETPGNPTLMISDIATIADMEMPVPSPSALGRNSPSRLANRVVAVKYTTAWPPTRPVAEILPMPWMPTISEQKTSG